MVSGNLAVLIMTLQAGVQAICSVLRTPIAGVDHLSVHLPDPDASKVQWTLECFNGKCVCLLVLCNLYTNHLIAVY